MAGLTLLAFYGPDSPVGINVAFTRTAVVMALLFVTLPFVVRAVQPVLLELDREMEQAAESLGAGRATVFRRIILPNLTPAILATTRTPPCPSSRASVANASRRCRSFRCGNSTANLRSTWARTPSEIAIP